MHRMLVRFGERTSHQSHARASFKLALAHSRTMHKPARAIQGVLVVIVGTATRAALNDLRFSIAL